MKVKIVQRKNPQKPDEPGKFYGQPVPTEEWERK